ncbi:MULTISPECIES: serine/threonine protein kinase [Microcystis]|uniref:serine/threonine protein kinase n=1 Tax=Microcystis TaxID=1125 RepID=UPI00084A2B6B|nr:MULTISPECIES: serine/threonine-protein kinase [Microcystis]MCA2716783.1 serine/threonine protein kinase [Microcystis sp. M169S2]MDB9387822.1 serine/threonine-protein kinase [Microcystis aeruginosa CS-583]GBE74479.1 serine/threonine protein kinase [Microcystis aeruginosa NIES-87]
MVWQAGQLLHNGKYEILEVLGRGGFGLTYKARHRQLTLEVVIKTPDILQKRDTEYEDYVRQFEAEGRKLAKFSQTPHAHIVRISDFFTEGQVPCLVMDFIQGQTLMERVKTQGKLSEAECLKYIRQIGSALEAVHQAGMVHRDAHPDNIMIQPNGNAILIDFGIAKEIIPASSSSTNSGANLYFAPYEQIVEHFQSQDRALENITSNRKPSVDVYTLAATFYYAVTGQKPTPSMERRLDNRPLTSPKEINPNLSDHLNKAITLGMALEKENRPQSMSDWLQQLELPPPPVEEKYRREIVNPPQPSNEPKVAETTAPVNPKPSENSLQYPFDSRLPSLRITVNPKPSENSLQKKLQALPWDWLIGVFLVYGAIGYILAANSAPWQVWAAAVAGNGLWVVVVAWVAVVFVVAAVAGFWAAAGVVAGVVAGLLVVGAIFLKTDSLSQALLSALLGLFCMAFPGLIGGITFSLTSGNFIEGIVTGIGSMVIVFTQVYIARELDQKNFRSFAIFLILAVTNLSGLASGWLLAFLLHSKG